MKMVVTEAEGKIVLTPQAVDLVDALYGKLAMGESLTEELLADRKSGKVLENRTVPINY